MKNVVLTGFMGTGKTAVGRELSRMLDMPLVDIDAEIEKEQGISISEIFSRHGEARFREIESDMIRRLSERKNLIISTGGGAVLKEDNMEALRKNGVVICLNAAPDEIYKRVKENSERPLLKVGDPMEKIRELMEYRRPFYERAGIMIDTGNKTPLQIAEEILEAAGCRR